MRNFLMVLLLMPAAALAQPAEGAFNLTLNIQQPLYKDFVGKSSAGMRVGYTRFSSEKFGWGIEAAYNTLNDYVPRQTYTYPGGAITTDIFNYMYYFTLLANAQYYFRASDRLVPYVSLGAGLAVTRYTLYYNVYEEGDNNRSWVVRPETGIIFRIRPYSALGLKSALSWEYAGNKSEAYDIKNFSALAFQLGIVVFSD
ncbi:MAG: outer membrane beta-barrel protein [Cyclobacteriaceae bacterium]|nr:outer membrane beta-barrel protein [Cyclobacteriaceae bacterium]MDW8332160.1 outer membrane beta-barrel protein [Cyclobacteriaceae bacterium]